MWVAPCTGCSLAGHMTRGGAAAGCGLRIVPRLYIASRCIQMRARALFHGDVGVRMRDGAVMLCVLCAAVLRQGVGRLRCRPRPSTPIWVERQRRQAASGWGRLICMYAAAACSAPERTRGPLPLAYFLPSPHVDLMQGGRCGEADAMSMGEITLPYRSRTQDKPPPQAESGRRASRWATTPRTQLAQRRPSSSTS